MREAVQALLSVQAENVDGLFVKLPCRNDALTDRIQTHYYYLRYQDGEPREIDLLNFLADHIIPYCIRQDKRSKLTANNARRMWMEAKRLFRLDDDKTGEPGELLSYVLAEGCLFAPKIITKMALKTNSSMPIHGSDGVHMSIDDYGGVYLHFIEAKMYKEIIPAIRSVLISVEKAITEVSSLSSPLDFELSLVENNLEIPEGDLRKLMSKVLNPYEKERDLLKYVHTCVIGYDFSAIDPLESIADLEDRLRRYSNTIDRYFMKKLSERPELRRLRWCMFFVPFSSVESFRTRFLELLSA